MKGYLDQRAELGSERARLAQLEERRDAFRAQLAAIDQPRVLEVRARELGMIRPGERSFLIRGELDPPPPPRRDGGDGGLLAWLTGLF